MEASYNCNYLIKSTRKLYLEPHKLWNKKKGIGFEHVYKTNREELQLVKVDYESASKLLETDLIHISNSLNKLLDIDLTQNQYDAIVSLIYDIGITAFKYSELRTLLNKGEIDEALSKFRIWNKFLGLPLYRLSKVRKLEIELFNKPC